MNQDKALKKVLRTGTSQLPYGFEGRVMKQIIAVTERKKKQHYAIGLAVTCTLAIILATGCYYVISIFFPFEIHLHLPTFELSNSSLALLKFSIYIGAMVLFLLVVDTYFRKFITAINKRKEQGDL